MSISKSTKDRITAGLETTFRVVFMGLVLVLGLALSIFFLQVTRNQAINSVIPVLLVEKTSKRCLVVYEPERNGLHACWPSNMTPAHRTLEVPAGTTALNIFEDPNRYLKKNSD